MLLGQYIDSAPSILYRSHSQEQLSIADVVSYYAVIDYVEILQIAWLWISQYTYIRPPVV